jgi:hypothetical protein
MTQQDDDDRRMSTEEAAELVRNDPALRAAATGRDENQGIDDDATTPDRAASDNE